MNIVLIRPPAGYSTGRKPNIMRGLYLLPQGLVYVGEALLRAGHSVSIIDVEAEGYLLGSVISELAQKQPDIVGITTTTPSWPLVEKIAKSIRSHFPDIKIGMGGPHATFEYSYILNSNLADVVFIGESEVSFPKYVNCIEMNLPLGGVHGIAVKVDGRIVKSNPVQLINIDQWGIPAYHLLNIEKYKQAAGVCISGMRGCPEQNCTFCLVPKLHSTDPFASVLQISEQGRAKSALTLFKEVLYLYTEYGVRNISFIDPTFTLYRNRVIEFCKLMRNAHLDLTWCCQTRTDAVDDSLLDNMARAGCVSILFGVESADDFVLSHIKKKNYINNATKAIEMCKAHGINATPSMIMGLPGETVESAQRSIDYAQYLNERFLLNNYLQFNTFMPSPGSSARKEMDQSYNIDYNISYAYWIVVPVIGMSTFSLDTHRKMWLAMYKLFYPDYYDTIVEICDDAICGRDFLLECFCEVQNG